MADVLFITPGDGADGDNESIGIGTLLLSTILREKNVDVEIATLSQFGKTDDFAAYLKSAIDFVAQRRPGIVSFYAWCDCYHIMLKIAEQIKARMDVYIVFGGPQADISAEQTISAVPYVDFVCCGEGETTIYPLFSSLLQGSPDLTVPGLVFRRDGKTILNPRPALIEDLDTLPFVDYSFLPEKPKAVSQHGFYIDVGRGCPFGCTYCSTKSFWGRKFRLKSPRRIVEEIKRVYEEFGVTYFNFAHDMFTLNRNSVVEVCRLIKQLDFSITWRCSARIDCIDNELIDLMADAGLKYIFIGIETGSVRMQKIVNKNLKLDKVLGILSHIRERGIKTITSFIYGFPEETEEDVSQTLAMIGDILKIGGVTVQTHLCTFLSGTEMSIKYREKLVPASIFSDLTGGTAIDECSELIVNHPDVFCHFYEYHSELRSRLEYFSLFCRVWGLLQPVFQYIAEKYPRDALIRMYDDFVEDNREILQDNRNKLMSEQIKQVIENDRFVDHFKADDCYDLIRDYYRMIAIQNSEKLQNGSMTEFFNFSPAQLKGLTSIQQFERRFSVVTFTRNENGSVNMHVRS